MDSTVSVSLEINSVFYAESKTFSMIFTLIMGILNPFYVIYFVAFMTSKASKGSSKAMKSTQGSPFSQYAVCGCFAGP